MEEKIVAKKLSRLEKLEKAAREATEIFTLEKRKFAAIETKKKRKGMDAYKFILGGYFLNLLMNEPIDKTKQRHAAVLKTLPAGSRRDAFFAAVLVVEAEIEAKNETAKTGVA